VKHNKKKRRGKRVQFSKLMSELWFDREKRPSGGRRHQSEQGGKGEKNRPEFRERGFRGIERTTWLGVRGKKKGEQRMERTFKTCKEKKDEGQQRARKLVKTIGSAICNGKPGRREGTGGNMGIREWKRGLGKARRV